MKLALEALEQTGLQFIQPVEYTFTAAAGSEYSYTYPTPDGAVAFALFTPLNSALISGTDHAGSYTMQINGQSVDDLRTFYVGPEYDNNSAISVGRQLHNDRLRRFYRNIGKEMRRFDQPVANSMVAADPSLAATQNWYQHYADHLFFPHILNRLTGAPTNTYTINSDGTDMQAKTPYAVYFVEQVLYLKGGRPVITPVIGS